MTYATGRGLAARRGRRQDTPCSAYYGPLAGDPAQHCTGAAADNSCSGDGTVHALAR